MTDEELNAFEEELRALRPGPPSARLRARLETLVDERAGDRPRPAAPADTLAWKQRLRRHGHWLAIAAGLALALAVYLWRPFEPLPEDTASANGAPGLAAPSSGEAAPAVDAEPRFRAVKARNTLKHRIDEGLVTLDGGLSARRYRFQFVDTIVWEDPNDGSRFEVSTPREELVLVPVHTF